eukprot:c54825_g1_i1 orf=156-320(+)
MSWEMSKSRKELLADTPPQFLAQKDMCMLVSYGPLPWHLSSLALLLFLHQADGV